MIGVVGPGVARAQERRKRERAAQADRLKDAPPPAKTRQQERAEDRRAGKMPRGMSQQKWHSIKGFPAIKRRGR